MPINPASVFGVLHRLGAGEITLDEAVADFAAREWSEPPYSDWEAMGGGDVPVPQNDWVQVVQAHHDRRISDEQYEALQEAMGPIVQRE